MYLPRNFIDSQTALMRQISYLSYDSPFISIEKNSHSIEKIRNIQLWNELYSLFIG